MANPFTPVGRFSYCKIWRPDVEKDTNKKRWSTVLILEPDWNDQLLVQMWQLHAQARQKFFPGAPAEGGGIHSPFRMGVPDNGYNGGYNLQKYPEYTGKLIVGFSSKDVEPDVVDCYAQKMVIGDQRLYSGCFGRVSYTLFAYGHKDPQAKKRGVSFGLAGLMVTGDGEPLVSRNDAAADFAPVAAKPADNAAMFGPQGGFPGQQPPQQGLWAPQQQAAPQPQQQWQGFTPQPQFQAPAAQVPLPTPAPQYAGQFYQPQSAADAARNMMYGAPAPMNPQDFAAAQAPVNVPPMVFNPQTQKWEYVKKNPLFGI